MIHHFIESWSLFGRAWSAGWLAAALLATVGLLLVARDQIFLGAAVSQASTLGVALVIALGAPLGYADPAAGGDSLLLSVSSLTFAVLAALATELGGGPGRESREGVTGWIFLLASAASVLLVSFHPHGMEQIQKLLFSSLLGASRTDVILLTGALLVVAAGLLLCHRRLVLRLLDPEYAALTEGRTRRWRVVTAAATGVAIGLAMRVAGMLFTFGCLVLPAMAAKNLTRTTTPILWLAPSIAVGVTACGFVVANEYDYPPAQLAVLFLAAAAIVAAVDLAGSWLAGGPLRLAALGAWWSWIDRDSLLLLQPAIERHLSPALWYPWIQGLLEAPAALDLAALALILWLVEALVGRSRRRARRG